MSQHYIENDHLSVRINEKGAELSSVIKKENGKEYMWQADSNFWGRHAPVLFPFVGKLKDNTYSYKGKSYNVGQHGFARDNDFELIDKTESQAEFSFKSSSQTMLVFPFKFELRIAYYLEKSSVKVRYHVLNTDGDEMYFSIGAHPAFNCPNDVELLRKDYAISFDNGEILPSYLLDNGNFNGKTKQVFDDKGIINLRETLFDDDALVFKDYKCSSVSIVNKKNKEPYLTLEFKGFPYLGIWSKNQESPFVCIEPWYGLADNIHHNGDITNKEGIQKLAAKTDFKCEHTILIH